MTPAWRARLGDLTADARAGDDAALASLFEQLHPLLVRIAQREIGRSHARLDAEDLASEVTLRLIERLRDGEGPEGDPVPYLARAIRNRVIDLRRAPAHREIGVDEFEALADAYARIEDADEQRHVDVAQDLEVVATALERLPSRQRDLLTAIAIDGMRPREIAAVTGEQPNTVAAAASRARRALRIEIRRTLLEAEGADACVAHRAALAAERTPAGAALEHLEGCVRCRRALARFAALPALGLALPLAGLTQLVVGGTAAPAVAAHAAGVVAADAVSDAGGRLARAGARPSRVVLAGAAVLVVLAAIASVVAALVLAPPPDAPAPAPEPSASAPVTDVSDDPVPSPTPTPGGGDAGPGTAAPTESNPVALEIDVAVAPGATSITVDLGLEAGATVERLRVDLPATMRIVDGGGWECSTTAGGGACTPPSHDHGGVVLVIAAVDGVGDAVGEATVEVVVATAEATVTASSTGTIRVAP